MDSQLRLTIAQHRRHRRGGRRGPRFAIVAAAVVAAVAPAPSAARAEVAVHHTPSGATDPPAPRAVVLPAAVGAWARVGPARRIDAAAIFDYMDGAGELYLAYRFDHLDVTTYRRAPGDEITAEVYGMRSADDAFGLLSGDWGGDEASLSGTPGVAAVAGPWPRALYGAGLLRVAADTVYARVLATRDGDEAKRAVLALGAAIVAGRREAPPPRLVAALPVAAVPGAAVRRATVCFFRSHLVLNSVYFLSRENLLELGPEVAAVTAEYDLPGAAGDRQRPRMVLVRYPDTAGAARALAHFRRVYLPEAADSGEAFGVRAQKIADGWVAARRVGRFLALVVECRDETTAGAFVAAGAAGLSALEDDHA